MAEPLKNQFGIEIPQKIAAMVAGVTPNFATEAFLNEVRDGYDDLDLMPRGWKIAEALHHHLPSNYEEAADILIASLGPKLEETKQAGMAPFLYLPHVLFVAKYGLEHFEASMQAQYELTQRFTAEFSIRPFLERYPEATLAQLKTWTQDPSTHVRRLVSEGTRPRLPWAPRLREFQKNPYPVLELLDLLKDDSELYVRRSVANNLNDIGKDHPSLLVEIAHRWLVNATDERRWLIRHALRSAVKRADPGAIAALGFSDGVTASIGKVSITPQPAVIGDSLSIAFEITNASSQPQRLLVDLRLHFVKANGKTSPKVFKLKTVELAPGETIQLGKAISLADMTTRKHYPGSHLIEIILNGQTVPLGSFELMRSPPPSNADVLNNVEI
ncbi:MAG: DNA alkylation repair protein [Oscillatoriophycideae cyanobacterium NC_groundwater_1537_Pr4_S-0.65um_50_18]|nr:DNA alkylation repair protein [Oscillatoriophycideae cyanobacterium NC_groundwater_1537_Pr4_S-0.65um_50_18]